MAIRNIRKEGDEILRKKSKPIEAVNEKIVSLLKDMAETMYKSDGVGLAAPQVGILKRMIVVDAGQGLLQLVNPVIKSMAGEQTYIEGCLSVPGIYGEMKRPETVIVEALNTNGEKIIIEGKELQAVVLCHEIDHLDGILFKDKAIRLIDKDDLDKE